MVYGYIFSIYSDYFIEEMNIFLYVAILYCIIYIYIYYIVYE